MNARESGEKIVKVLSEHREALEFLVDGASDVQLRTGNIKEVNRVEDLNLSAAEIIKIAFEVAIAITTVGGALQRLDWLWEKLQPKKDEIVLHVNGKTIIGKNISSIDELRELIGKA